LNKVDLPSANPEEVSDDIIDLLDVNRRYSCFRKTGFGVKIFWPPLLKKFHHPGNGRAFTSFDI
jgi:GTP-binding protein LepA